MAASTPGLSVILKLTNQWSGAFDGELSLSYTGSAALSQWSVSFSSRYALRSLSNFSFQQVQQSDGSWLITLAPPSWGNTLKPGRIQRSYVQGILPSGKRLSSLNASEVLLPAGSGGGGDAVTPPITPPVTPPPITPPVTPPPITPPITPPVTPLPPGGLNSGNAADALWGEQFFAPYVDMGLYPVPDLDGLARHHGVGLFTLGFIQATASGEAAWAGLPALSLTSGNSQAVALRQEISQLRAVGGDAMLSFGGASGISLAQKLAASGASAADLAHRYAQVVDTLALNRIDFDIEGAALANPGANQLLAKALKLLQQSHPDLEIWFTLPVLPQGLTADGLKVVRQALEAGVKLDGVNIMAMDYGDGAAPPALKGMGAYAIDAANNSFQQLRELFAGFGQGFGWNQLGVTPMIGVNDVITEVFTSSDAQLLEDFARDKGLGMLSMWSIARDQPGPLGQVGVSHSGTSAASGSYSAIWGDYGSDPLISGGGSNGGSSSSSGSGSGSGSGGDVGGGGVPPLPTSSVNVAPGTTALIASSSTAERFQLGYAWGRTLTISGFDPSQDVLDLKGFWSEGKQARVLASTSGASVLLDFNAQQVLLPGVEASSLTTSVLQIWQG